MHDEHVPDLLHNLVRAVLRPVMCLDICQEDRFCVTWSYHNKNKTIKQTQSLTQDTRQRGLGHGARPGPATRTIINSKPWEHRRLTSY